MRLLWVLLWLLSLSHLGVAQTRLPLEAASQRITFTEVVPADSFQRSELYTQTVQWLYDTYKSPHQALDILVHKRETGTLAIRGSFIPTIRQGRIMTTGRLLRYTLRLDLQEGYYTYTLTDYQLENPGAGTPLPLESLLYSSKGRKTQTALRQQYEQQVITHAQQLSESLKRQLSKRPDGEVGPW
ncbi:DUF4468 domain-containing protein [Hymenobacter sp. BT188]|uniref:DUF4468 domain-containing protein n=1 Tax=Hymenobacter sp. BT188 TaxID=2763504 RepID=UPI00165141A0|nr:DUF4468 domain-containing protein [Hymenobacter sp. BT188]